MEVRRGNFFSYPASLWQVGRTLAVAILLALIVWMAFEVRLSDLGRNYIEANEGGTYFLAQAPFNKYFVWGGTESDYTGSEAEWNGILAYYGMFHCAQSWLGTDEFSLRFLPVCCGVAGVLAIFALGKRLGGNGAGLLAALCLALNWEHIALSSCYRFNSLAVLMVIICTYLCLVAVQKRERWCLALYLLSITAMIWSMVLSVFILLAHWLYMILALTDRTALRRALISSVSITFLALLPTRLFDSVALQRIAWYPKLSFDRFAELWSAIIDIWPELSRDVVFTYIAIYVCLLAAGGAILIRCCQLARARVEAIGWRAVIAGWNGWRAIFLLSGVAGGALAVTASLFSLYGHDTTLMYDRGVQSALLNLFNGSTWIYYGHTALQRLGPLGILIVDAALLKIVWPYLPIGWRKTLSGLVSPRLVAKFQRQLATISPANSQVSSETIAPAQAEISAETVIALLALAVPLTAMCLYTLLIQPILLTRNICCLIPAAALLIGIGFSRCNWGGKVLVLACLWFSWPGLSFAQSSRLEPMPSRTDGWSLVASVVQSEAHDGDCLILKSVNGPTYRYYVDRASQYLRFPVLKVWPEFAWNGSPCPQTAFSYGQEFVRRIRPEQTLWVIHDEPWFNIMHLCDEDLEGFTVERHWFFGFGMQLTKLRRETCDGG